MRINAFKGLSVPIILLLASTLSTLAQKPSDPPSPAAPQTLGEINDGQFISKRLGISLLIPKDFTIVSGAEAELLANAGADVLKQGKASDKKIDEAIWAHAAFTGDCRTTNWNAAKCCS